MSLALDDLDTAPREALAAELRAAWSALAAQSRGSVYGAGAPAPTRGCAFCDAAAVVLRGDAQGVGICRGCVARAAALCEAAPLPPPVCPAPTTEGGA